MAHFILFLVVLTLVVGSTVALVSELMIASVFLLNTFGGSSQLHLMMASLIGQATAKAVDAGAVPSPQTLAGEAFDVMSDPNAYADLEHKTKRSAERFPHRHESYISYRPAGDSTEDSVTEEYSGEESFIEELEKFRAFSFKLFKEFSDHIGLNRTGITDILKGDLHTPNARAALGIVYQVLHVPIENLGIYQGISDLMDKYEELQAKHKHRKENTYVS